MVYIGARDYEQRKQQAEEEARRVQAEYEQKQLTLAQAQQKLESIESGSQYNKVDISKVAPAVTNPTLRSAVSSKIEEIEKPRHFGSKLDTYYTATIGGKTLSGTKEFVEKKLDAAFQERGRQILAEKERQRLAAQTGQEVYTSLAGKINKNYQNNTTVTETKPQSTLTAAEKPQNFAERALKQSDVLTYQKEQSTGWKRQELAVKSAAYSAAGSVTYPFYKPKEFAKGLYQTFRHPVKSFKEMGTQFVEKPEQFLGSLAGNYAFGKIATKVGGKVVSNVRKLSPSYVSYPKTGITLVEDVSIPTELKTLKTFEGKKVPSVHTTFSSDLKLGTTIAPASTEKLSQWRKDIGQRSFYTSSPIEEPLLKQTPTSEVKVSYKGTPIQERYKPVAYGGYIGIGKGYSASNVEFSILPKGAKAFVFREAEITRTPREIARKPIREVVKYQTERAGTYVAAENIKGWSKEGQFTTSPGTEEFPLMQIVENPKGELRGKFTYYNLKKPVPELLGGSTASKPVKVLWDLATSENKKIKFYEAEFKELAPSVRDMPKLTDTSSLLDITDYNSKYGRTISYSSADLLKYGLKFPYKQRSTPRNTPEYESPAISKPKSSAQSIPSYPKSSLSFGKSSPSLMSSSSVSRSSKTSSPSRSSSSSASSMSSMYSSKSSSSSALSSLASSFSSASSSRSSSSSKASSSKSSYSSSSSYGSSYTTVPPSSPSKWVSDYSRQSRQAFDVYYKQAGEWKMLASGLPKGLALKAGSEFTKRTLRASFKLKPYGITTKEDIAYFPQVDVFRTFKISKGEKIPLENTFIQKAEKRLSSSSEVSEIQEALWSSDKMKKRKGWFW